MDLHYLKIFNVMATELSFSRTANELYISQPAVSVQIKKLEKDLGVTLFNRKGRKTSLSEDGRILHEYTKKIFLLADEAEIKLRHRTGHLRGIISVAASNTPGTYIMPSIIGEFKEKYPFVEVNLHIGNTFEVEKLVIDNKVDFAVSGGDVPYSGQVGSERLFCDDIVIIAAPANRIFTLENIEPSDLINLPLISHEKSSQLYKAFEGIMLELGIPLVPAMSFGSIDAIKQAVAANLGISVAPRSSISIETKFGLLKQISLKGKRWDYPYNLIYHRSRHLQPQCSELMDMVREKMKGNAVY